MREATQTPHNAAGKDINAMPDEHHRDRYVADVDADAARE
jgi:hypothetical protein